MTCTEPTHDELLADSESPVWDAAVCWIGDGSDEALAAVAWLKQFRDFPVIAVGRSDTARAAVDALQRGASNYVPFRNRREPPIEALERTRRFRGIDQRASRWDAIDQRAAAIAHDINNLLAIIGGHCECAMDRVPAGDPLHDVLRVIGAASRRGAALTGQFLPFGSRAAEPEVLELNALIAGMEPVLRRLVGEQVEFRVRLAPDLWPVRADAGDMEQIVMNLLLNARDAVSRHGTIAVETENARSKDPPDPGLPESPVGDRVLLAISDTGGGMDEETKARIFEPCFTTKKPGKGSGLGLARVQRAVHESGGRIEVQSEPGLGTRFTVHLPRAAEALPDVESAAGRRRAETLPPVQDEECKPGGPHGPGQHGGGALRHRKGGDDRLIRGRGPWKPA